MTRLKLTGGCRCGAVRYQTSGKPIVHAICHCNDCRRSAGAPSVSWLMVKEEQLAVLAGEPKEYQSSEAARRFFCGTCGTGLFYRNATVLPGIVDIQSGTLDAPDQIPAQMHIQAAERIDWMVTTDDLPVYERYPPLG